MKERPILFSGEMVRAILAGRKTQTRRVMKRQPSLYDVRGWHETGALCGHGWQATTDVGFWPGPMESVKCPYGQPGDRLWVRERLYFDADAGWKYWADETLVPEEADYARKTQSCPSIHMPRVACRLLLDVKRVWVERLQDITNKDALAEGIIEEAFYPDDGFPLCRGYTHEFEKVREDQIRVMQTKATHAFRNLWDSINGEPRKDGTDISWAANPWVWCIEFEVKR